MTVQVLAITSDLFLQSRITEVTRSLSASATMVMTEDALLREANSRNANLVILDLDASDYDPFLCAQRLKNMTSPPKILAIFPHIRTDLKLKAENIMIDFIVPNSGFLKTLKNILETEVRGK